MFPMHKKGGSYFYFNAFNSFPGRMTGVIPPISRDHRLVNLLGLPLYTGTHVVFYCLKTIYWQH